jgi:hypothetical protein
LRAPAKALERSAPFFFFCSTPRAGANDGSKKRLLPCLEYYFHHPIVRLPLRCGDGSRINIKRNPRIGMAQKLLRRFEADSRSPLIRGRRVEILVAMRTLVNILEIPTHMPAWTAQAIIRIFPSGMNWPFFIFTYGRIARACNIHNVSENKIHKNVHFCPDLPSPYLSPLERL